MLIPQVIDASSSLVWQTNDLVFQSWVFCLISALVFAFSKEVWHPLLMRVYFTRYVLSFKFVPASSNEEPTTTSTTQR
jgi:hypothetical protein